MVLADAPTPGADGYDLTLADLLQAAIAGVRDYQRVQILSTPDGRLVRRRGAGRRAPAHRARRQRAELLAAHRSGDGRGRPHRRQASRSRSPTPASGCRRATSSGSTRSSPRAARSRPRPPAGWVCSWSAGWPGAAASRSASSSTSAAASPLASCCPSRCCPVSPRRRRTCRRTHRWSRTSHPRPEPRRGRRGGVRRGTGRREAPAGSRAVAQPGGRHPGAHRGAVDDPLPGGHRRAHPAAAALSRDGSPSRSRSRSRWHPQPAPEPVAVAPEPEPEPTPEPELVPEPVALVPEPEPEPVAAVPDPGLAATPRAGAAAGSDDRRRTDRHRGVPDLRDAAVELVQLVERTAPGLGVDGGRGRLGGRAPGHRGTERPSARSGLPVRRPGQRLVPGGVTAAAPPVVRDPEAIRARLAAHAAGVSRGPRPPPASRSPPTRHRRKPTPHERESVCPVRDAAGPRAGLGRDPVRRGSAVGRPRDPGLRRRPADGRQLRHPRRPRRAGGRRLRPDWPASPSAPPGSSTAAPCCRRSSRWSRATCS